MSNYPVNTIVVLTEGEYSDYRHETVVKVIKEYESLSLMEMFYSSLLKKGYTKSKDDDWHDPEGKLVRSYQHNNMFTAWFINESGLVEEVEHSEMHMGSYGDIKISDR